ncbi:MAG: ABC transporter permease [Chloroflexi bacterium RBG_16_54_18]|nr:MAG: ABC transporter permease [Chloroflexi bacterium RBG_16_54_18]
MERVSKFFRSTVAGPLVALLVVVGLVTLATDRFFMMANLSNVSLQVAPVAIVAIGATLVILTGGIDLSPGSTVALVCCTLAILVKKMGLPLPVGIFLVLLLGVACGAVNGFLSTYGRIPSFIVTLATMSIFRGLAFLITGGTPIFSVSDALEPIFYGKFLGIPLPFYYVVVFYALASLFLRNTIQGRAIYAVGGNESAARLTGLAVNRSKMVAFLIAGLTAGIAGVLTTAWLNSGSPNYGAELGLQSIAAAVIGGASLVGGYGSMVATLIGALTVAVVQNGLNLLTVPASWQEITLGIVIIAAVGLDMWKGTFGRSLARIFRQS